MVVKIKIRKINVLNLLAKIATHFLFENYGLRCVVHKVKPKLTFAHSLTTNCKYSPTHKYQVRLLCYNPSHVYILTLNTYTILTITMHIHKQ